MIEVRQGATLGHHQSDWLESRFHFSFAEYFDSDRMGFGPLRVLNDDVIRPGTGFPMHPHRDMEIITYVRRGAVSHEDSLGNRGRTAAGDVQVMTAGSGIVHSEYNLESEDATTLFQIWIEPSVLNLAPRWQTRQFPRDNRSGHLTVLASGRAGDRDALPIHQDAALLGATVAAGESISHTLETGRRAYIVAARGAIAVNGVDAAERDGVAAWDETALVIEARDEAEIVLIDLP